jgi:hypothetical protein
MNTLHTSPIADRHASRAESDRWRAFPPGPILRGADELVNSGLREDRAVRLSNARVVCADYDLLQHDFPQLTTGSLERRHPGLGALRGAELRAAIRTAIDAWLLRHAAFISRTQAAQCVVNTPIPVTGHEIRAYRPTKYGRALVLAVADAYGGIEGRALHGAAPEAEGLLDVKGTGCAPDRTPSFELHSDGLLKLSDAFIELLNQRLIQRACRHSGSGFETVPIYAVLYPGFDLEDEGGPAALLARRAHLRPIGTGGLVRYGSLEQVIQLEAELMLRRYGISSCNAVTRVTLWKEDGTFRIRYGHKEIDFLTAAQLGILEQASCYKEGTVHYDGVNVQITRDVAGDPLRAQLIDFGTYRVFERFDNPVLSLVSDRLLRWGGTIRPGSGRFIQPDPLARVPFEQWGESGEIRGYAGEKEATREDILCAGLAADYRAGTLGRDELTSVLEAYLDAGSHWWPDLQTSTDGHRSWTTEKSYFSAAV